ncbi:pro-sigmaK processing inhibitor BofA family protein [Oceanobacillus alkalisoli]|uniref:pro-sigmaK processing inhibitor BofA family protein n=1 Tax=Oceanobacillus alkalisoli TaxID=2925113 RepID=UPI001F119612|nr:pro-sigmaK processing inhibitor BofA family protein [Oceanobacillus alkalisoli]MCF3944065.1 pro-sigmaK processing inhibitor BofA family protein [Oceanobacillus alkalisoli]
MSSTLIIIIMISVIVLLLTIGAPVKPMKILGQGAVKLVIGALLLFFVNVFGANFGIHVPINLFTALVSGLLGIFGVGSLVAIHLFIL